jgi:hypothetical protein
MRFPGAQQTDSESGQALTLLVGVTSAPLEISEAKPMRW